MKTKLILFLLLTFLIVGISGENISADEKIEELIEDLMSYNWQERRDAVLDLQRRGDKAKEAIPELILVSGDPNFIISFLAQRTLNSLGIDTNQKIEVLTEFIKETEDDRIFQQAILALVAIDYDESTKEKAKAAFSDLALAVGAVDNNIVRSALEAINKISDEQELISYLEKSLDDTDIEKRIKAAAGLIRLNYERPETIDVVIEGLKSDKSKLIENAIISWEMMSQGSKELVQEKVSISEIEKLQDRLRQESYQYMRDLQPAGYWPVDEGEGNKLYDRSGNENHGDIYHVPWQEGQLNFTGRFQWLNIPAYRPEFKSEQFTIGGWVYSRRSDYTDSGHANGMIFFGEFTRNRWVYGQAGDFSINLRNDNIEIISGGQSDAIGSIEDNITFAAYNWQHILYSYEDGIGRLYLNGQLVKEDYTSGGILTNRLLIGNDASWWMLYPNGSRALDGSVRELVFFDRALPAETINEIYESTRPSVKPPEVDDEEEIVAEKELSLEELTAKLKDENIPEEERLKSAWRIKEIGEEAWKTVPVLVEVLEKILEQEGIYMPGVEDNLRNVLIKSLLEINHQDEKAREVLGLALAKPIFDLVDISSDELNEVQELVQKEQYMDALDIYRNMDSELREEQYFSQGNKHRDNRPRTGNERAYTPTTMHNGITYRIGDGRCFWNVATKIPKEEYEQIVEELAEEYPEAADWRSSDHPHLYRVRITKIDQEGNEETAFLEGDWFIFDGSDGKYRGWSIAVDKDGYLHLMGGQHNWPEPRYYIPGSLEKIGLSRYHSDNYPKLMYWVSEEPGNISSFEFVGQRISERRLPTDRYNYMNFVNDREGELYTYGRINADGLQSWGFYRYDVNSRRWEPVGGYTFDVIESARNAQPEWKDLNFRQIRGSVPRTRGDKALVWAWQPNFYNYIRSTWGVYFDQTNRMHVNVPVRGIGEKAEIIDGSVYAYSDDGGETFYRADGTEVKLPLTVNPAPAHNAQLERHSTLQWWDLWTSLLEYAGFYVPNISR